MDRVGVCLLLTNQQINGIRQPMANESKKIGERLADGWRWIIRRLTIVEQPQQITYGSAWDQEYPTPSPYPVMNSMAAFGQFPGLCGR